MIMKKSLLISAAMLTMSLAASAQDAVKFETPKGTDLKSVTVAPVASAPCNELYNQSVNKAARRTIADGVSYGRPEGTYYIAGSTSNGNYMYTFVPAYKKVTYKNFATDKANAKWQYGSTTMYDLNGNDDNDLEVTWPKIDRGYIQSAFIPTLSVGDISYRFGDELSLTQSALINGDSLLYCMQVNRAGGAYYGFSDAAIFGSGTRNMKMEDESTVSCKRAAIYEFFQKPAAPFCLSSVSFPIVSYGGTANPIPAGTTMKLYVVKMTDEGKLDETVAELPFTNDDIQDLEIDNGKTFGVVELSQKTEDEFGTLVEEPIIIDFPYAIVITGFEQAGVDFSLYMVDVMSTERDYYENEGGIEGTCCSYVREDTGEALSGLYYVQTISKTGPNAQYARQYNAYLLLNGMFDVAEVDSVFAEMTAPVEGGDIYAEVEVTNSETNEKEIGKYALEYQTTCPRLSDWTGLEGVENYFFEDLPEWLTVEGYDDQYYAEEGITIAKIVAAPLPTGTTGRQAKIRVASDKGAHSIYVTVTQGDATTGINTIKNNTQAVNATAFNLAGQRVNDNFKGLVIKNGKKFMNK